MDQYCPKDDSGRTGFQRKVCMNLQCNVCTVSGAGYGVAVYTRPGEVGLHQAAKAVDRE
jgi:hypothetical protein